MLSQQFEHYIRTLNAEERAMETKIMPDQAYRAMREREVGYSLADQAASITGDIKELHRQQCWSEVRRLGHEIVHEGRMWRETLSMVHYHNWKSARRMLVSDLAKWRSNYDACLTGKKVGQ